MPVRRSHARVLVLLGVLSILIATAIPGFTTPGELDPNFDGDGRVTTRIGGFEEIQDLAIQPDGKIVAAGYAGGPYRFALARYNVDGSPDPRFWGGQVTIDFGSSADGAWGVAVGTNGKIVAAGWTDGANGYDFAVVRFNSDGSLDDTFGVEGKVTTGFGGLRDEAHAVTIQNDGKVLAVGVGFGDFALARYNTDGSLDATFDGDGRVSTDFFSHNSDIAFAVALLGDGRIVIAGSADTPGPRGPDFALARYHSNGSLDPTFGTDGKVTTDFGGTTDVINGIAIHPDGRIVAAGENSGDFALARYNSDGSLDTTFGRDGKVATNFGPGWDGAYDVAIQSNGRIVAAGDASFVGARVPFALTRYNGNGSLDHTFGVDGKVTTNFGGIGWDEARAVALQSDGKIVAGGFASLGGERHFALARYLADGLVEDRGGGISNPVLNPPAPLPGTGQITATGAGSIAISLIHFDPPGADNANQKMLNQERVRICNVGERSRSLARWHLRDSDGNNFQFSSLRLGAGDCIRIHSGAGHDSPRDLHWGSDRAIWDNTGDRATLRNRSGDVVDRCRYGRVAQSPKVCL